MARVDLLRQLSFGSQVAEDEVQELANYFVETYQWDQIANGKLDIIRGEKGAGKSAIYSLLTTKTEKFFDRGILLVAAENPPGATVFVIWLPIPQLRNRNSYGCGKSISLRS